MFQKESRQNSSCEHWIKQKFLVTFKAAFETQYETVRSLVKKSCGDSAFGDAACCILIQLTMTHSLPYVATSHHDSRPALRCCRSTWLMACCMLLQVTMAHGPLCVAAGHHGSWPALCCCRSPRLMACSMLPQVTMTHKQLTLNWTVRDSLHTPGGMPQLLACFRLILTVQITSRGNLCTYSSVTAGSVAARRLEMPAKLTSKLGETRRNTWRKT